MNVITWPQRVRDLQASGMTYAEIAAATGLAPSSVGDLAQGRSKAPLGDAAVALYHLHAARCRQAPQPAPKSEGEAA